MIVTLILNTCSCVSNTITENYISNVSLSEEERILLQLATHGDDYTLCEFEANNFKSLTMVLEYYENGEIITRKKVYMMDETNFSKKGKFNFSISEENEFNLSLLNDKGVTSYEITLDDIKKEDSSVYAVKITKPIRLIANSESILYLKAYSEPHINYNSDNILEDIKETDLIGYSSCYIVRVIVGELIN